MSPSGESFLSSEPKYPPFVAPSPGGHVERVLELLLGGRTRKGHGIQTQVGIVTRKSATGGVWSGAARASKDPAQCRWLGQEQCHTAECKALWAIIFFMQFTLDHFWSRHLLAPISDALSDHVSA